MNNKIIVLFSTIICLGILSGCGRRTEEHIDLKIAHASSENSTTQIVCEAFAEKTVELLGEDRISVSIYPNATLGTEAEMVEALQMGTLDAGTFGRHSAIDARMEILNLPFLFESDEHVKAVLRDEEGEPIRKKLNSISEENGIVMLGWYETGFREITSNREITSINDLNGLLIRTPSTDTLIKSFHAWGASPTAVDLAELYSALQSKVVDAQENPLQLIMTNNLFEVQDFICISNHLTIPNQLAFSKKVWDTYPNDVKEALLEAGRYACEVGGDYNVQQNNSLLDELSNNMTVTYMDEKSLSRMKELAMNEVWPQFVTNDTEKIVEEIRELAK